MRTTERHYLGPDQARALFRPGDLPFDRRLVSTYPLEVYYNRVYAANFPYRDSPYAYSMLLLPNQLLELTTNGGITQAKRLRIVMQGISNEGVPISFSWVLPVR